MRVSIGLITYKLAELRKSILEEWQTSWKNGDTGTKIYNIMPSVSLRPTNWIRALSLLTSKGFTSLTAIIAVVAEFTSLCHGVYSHSVLAYEETSAKLRKRMDEKSRQ
ncbi:hypothetical protein AVEN_155671-1 [Araneus ventricosus]|uniref:Uncharacterized protein n=1 Tax=Araneus ventricosus TaxID=182803 RepID=A0A4Y2QK83_ARAVE|nr:hypothetical protein AVEN_155671-1 [Araneus ventricosus]